MRASISGGVGDVREGAVHPRHALVDWCHHAAHAHAACCHGTSSPVLLENLRPVGVPPRGRATRERIDGGMRRYVLVGCLLLFQLFLLGLLCVVFLCCLSALLDK